MLKGMELSGAAGHFSRALSSLALDTDEAMSASSMMVQDADDAMSESSWSAVAKEEERYWWSIDLESEMEKLAVVGPMSGTEDGSVDPKWKMPLVSSDKNYKRRKKETEVEVDDAVPQEGRVDIQSPKS